MRTPCIFKKPLAIVERRSNLIICFIADNRYHDYGHWPHRAGCLSQFQRNLGSTVLQRAYILGSNWKLYLHHCILRMLRCLQGELLHDVDCEFKRILQEKLFDNTYLYKYLKNLVRSFYLMDVLRMISLWIAFNDNSRDTPHYRVTDWNGTFFKTFAAICHFLGFVR